MTATLGRAGRLVIVCGLLGSGKTALARRLETEDLAVRFCPDEWMADLGIDLFDGVAREKIERLQWQIAQRLLQLGATVIIEWGTWARAERDALRHGARSMGAKVELRFLDAPVEVLWARVRDRNMEQVLGRRALTREDIDGYERLFERPDKVELSLYDPPPAGHGRTPVMFFVVLRRTGPQWDPSRPLEEQPDWAAHASFMNELVDSGFVVLGGPLADEHRVVLVVEAESEDAVRAVLGRDPWSETHLQIDKIDAWTIRLDGRGR